GGVARAVLVEIGTDHVGAFAREDQCGRAADTARGAGDDDGLASEVVWCFRHRARPCCKAAWSIVCRREGAQRHNSPPPEIVACMKCGNAAARISSGLQPL